MSRFQAPTAALLAATLLTIAVGRESPTEGPYVGAQASVWNGVHRALFHRVGADGKPYGDRELDPLLFASSTWPLREPRASEIETALSALVDSKEAIASSSSVARAILQRDLWAWHDWLASRADQPDVSLADRALAERLRGSCAHAMRPLALDSAELEQLGAALDAARARLDADLAELLDERAAGAWVRLAPASGDGVLARDHTQHFAPRSAFSVHLRMPGGRDETLQYLARLAAADPTVSVDGVSRLDPRLPQPPAGTRVALVRRALHVDRDGDLHVLPLVESVQMRAFPRTEPPELARRDGQFVDMQPYDGTFWRAFQEVRELDLDRAGLLADGRGLREVGPGEAKLSSFGAHGWDPLESEYGFRSRLESCTGCHGASGMHSVISFTGVSSGPGTHMEAPLGEPPRKLSADTSDAWRSRALADARAQPQLALLLAEWEPKREAGAASDGH